jgi:hypothetical protein
MLRRERREPALRLLELAFTADPVAAPCLVPGDDDVDEPLEEVTLVGVGGPPRQLELLVRFEPAPLPRQLQPALERLVDQVSSGGFWTLCSVAYSFVSWLTTSKPSP